MNTNAVKALREALARAPRIAVKISLDSGPCWVTAVGLSGRARSVVLHVELAGARLELAGARLLEVAPLKVTPLKVTE